MAILKAYRSLKPRPPAYRSLFKQERSDGLKEVSKTMFDWSRNILGGLEKRIKKL
jgi:hypothetical protein